MDTKKIDIIYKELSFKVIGALFEVYNELGAGHPERIYQKALEIEFKSRLIKLEPQEYCEVVYKNEKLGAYLPDFIVDDKMILELKIKPRFSKVDFDQVKKYLKIGNYKLGILASFCRNGVKFARVLNL